MQLLNESGVEAPRIFRFTLTTPPNGDVVLSPEGNSPGAHAFRYQVYLRWPSIPYNIKALGRAPYTYLLIEKGARDWWSKHVAACVIPPTPFNTNVYGKQILLISLPKLDKGGITQVSTGEGNDA